MIIPFSIESHIKKAQKNGFTSLEIRTALSNEELWIKILHKRWSFPRAFDYYLNLGREGFIDSEKRKPKEMVTIYKKQR